MLGDIVLNIKSLPIKKIRNIILGVGILVVSYFNFPLALQLKEIFPTEPTEVLTNQSNISIDPVLQKPRFGCSIMRSPFYE